MATDNSLLKMATDLIDLGIVAPVFRCKCGQDIYFLYQTQRHADVCSKTREELRKEYMRNLT